MPKIAITTSRDDSNNASPTDNQIATWEEQELAEAEADNMLGDEEVTTIFEGKDSTSPTID